MHTTNIFFTFYIYENHKYYIIPYDNFVKNLLYVFMDKN